MSAFNSNTHFGAFLSTENHFRPKGLVGFVTQEVLRGFADASGQEGSAVDQVLTVNGLLSTPALWQAFDNKWQPFLRNAGFKPDPKTERYVFHASPFWADDCELMPLNLTYWDKKKIYNGLIDIIRDHTVYRFGYAVLLNDFRKIEEEFPYVRQTWLQKPGTRMSMLCFEWNSVWAHNNNYDTSIHYTFDRGDTFFGEMYSTYRAAVKKLGTQVTSIIANLAEENKAIFSPIQAADILAWECRTYFQRLIVDGKLGEFISGIRPSPELIKLHTKGASDLRLYNQDDLRYEIIKSVNKTLTDERREILIGDGKPFKDVAELARGLFRMDQEEEQERQKAARRQRMQKAD